MRHGRSDEDKQTYSFFWPMNIMDFYFHSLLDDCVVIRMRRNVLLWSKLFAVVLLCCGLSSLFVCLFVCLFNYLSG